ncbi:MAG TPA: hypothetical protein VH044_02960 [Polyangiaceae bacterium]|jgi:hypothetical protein|nr:hypothetical protein [Polyangiaceae bacterium]
MRWPRDTSGGTAPSAGVGRRLEGVAFAGAVAVIVGSLFAPRLLPCVDYAQHLALADVARRLLSPGAPEHALFELNLFTYYGLVHLVVAALSLVLPIEIAGKVVLGGALALTAASTWRLLRALGRPVEYAALFVPMLFSFSVSWGFLNYLVALAVAFAALAEVARQVQAPTRRGTAITAGLSLVCAMTHPLAMLVLWVFAGSLALELAWRSTGGGADGPSPSLSPALLSAPRLVAVAERAALGLAPTLPGGLWCAAVYLGHDQGMPHVTDTRDIVFWPKILRFSVFATDLHADRTDADILYATLEVMAAIAVAALAVTLVRRARGARVPAAAPVPTTGGVLVLPFVALLACYLAMPMIFMGSQLMFPRLVPALFLSALLVLPRIDSAPLADAARVACLVVAWWGALNLSAHLRQYGRETDDASRLIDHLPPGRRASALVFRDFTDAFWRGGLLHLAAYYAARKHGDWAYSFARYDYMPVRYRAGRAPPWPEHGWEFDPKAYDPRSPYARAYDLLLIKTPETEPIEDEGELRARIFGPDAPTPRLLSHEGLYWAFDTAGIPERVP